MNWDKSILIWSNLELGSSALDPVMILLSDRWFWNLLGVLTLCRALVMKRWMLIGFFGVILLMVIVGDAVAYNFIKPWIARLRPCHLMPEELRLVNGCGGRFGFPSNHALNAMTVAASIWFAGYKWLGNAAIMLAVLVGYSRVYLGVHYPSDILAGFALGIGLAWIGNKFMRMWLWRNY